MITVNELLHMDVGYVAALNKIAHERATSENAAANKAGEEVEDAMIDGG